MSGEIILFRGEFDIAIATGKPPAEVTVTADGLHAEGAANPVQLDPPRILADGFAFRALIAVPSCRISYHYAG